MSDDDYGEDSFDAAKSPVKPDVVKKSPEKAPPKAKLSEAEMGELDELQAENDRLQDTVRKMLDREKEAKARESARAEEAASKIEVLKQQLKVAKENDLVTKERDKLRYSSCFFSRRLPPPSCLPRHSPALSASVWREGGGQVLLGDFSKT